MRARYGGTCPWCTGPIRAGDEITPGDGRWRHERCVPEEEAERRANLAARQRQDERRQRQAAKRQDRREAYLTRPAPPGTCPDCAGLGFVTAASGKNWARTVPCACRAQPPS